MPDQLCELLAKGELDVALMARPDGFPAPLRASKLYSERFVIACSAGHRFAMENEIRMADLNGEFYLSRIGCEFYNVLDDLCREHGLVKSYQSEREDWILTMVAAGMGVCFLPEYTATFPGVVGCPVVLPSVERNAWSPSPAVAGHADSGIRASGAATSLAVGLGRPRAAQN